MEIDSSLLSIFLLVAGGQGLFLSFLLFRKKENKGASRILSFLVLSIAYPMVAFGFWYNDQLFQISVKYFFHTYATIDPIPLIIGPLLYLYASKLIAGNRKLGFKYLHLLPGLAFTISRIPLFLESAEFKIARLSMKRMEEIEAGPGVLLILCYNLIYLFLTASLLKRHSRSIKHEFSDIEKISLPWLRQLILIFAGLWFVYTILLLLQLQGVHLFVNPDFALLVAFSLTIYVIGYFGHRQKNIFSGEVRIDLTERPKYANSGLDPSKVTFYVQSVKDSMEKDQLFKKGDIKLDELAAEVNISKNQLSQILNEHFEMTFYDFINRYRVEEVKKLIRAGEAERYTILNLAFQSGFNSKSAFNAAFKKHEKMTPSAFARNSS